MAANMATRAFVGPGETPGAMPHPAALRWVQLPWTLKLTASAAKGARKVESQAPKLASRGIGSLSPKAWAKGVFIERKLPKSRVSVSELRPPPVTRGKGVEGLHEIDVRADDAERYGSAGADDGEKVGEDKVLRGSESRQEQDSRIVMPSIVVATAVVTTRPVKVMTVG